MNENERNDNLQHSDSSQAFLTEKREGIFGILILLLGLGLGNCLIFGGMNLGFAVMLLGALGAAVLYLIRSGCRGGWYAWTVLGLCAVIIPGFARTDDGFVKYVLGNFLFVGINLGLVTLAGRNLWDPAGVGTLLDSLRGFFGLGFGKLPHSFRGIRNAVKEGGTVTKNGMAMLLGAAITVPILAIMIPLLMRSDAAFEGLLKLLPEFDFAEAYATVMFGGVLGCALYTRTVSLVRMAPEAPIGKTQRKGLNPFTMNTVLYAVCVLYLVYLVSQLAYFVGGFSGILPEGYSLAEYARRGFFEMAWLCVINLTVMVLGISVTAKREGKTPLSTRIACLFIGLVTLFLVIAAGAKMVMYIGWYGMTRLRVLTMVIMVFLGLTTTVVCIWLFAPKVPYMKILVITALVIGAAVLWTDVDSFVAGYNVDVYLSGEQTFVDVDYLSSLGYGAVPHIERLAREAKDSAVRESAEQVLRDWWIRNGNDLRDWNYNQWIAREILEAWPAPEDSDLLS